MPLTRPRFRRVALGAAVALAALLLDLLLLGARTATRIGPSPPLWTLIALLVVLYAPLVLGSRIPLVAFASVWIASLIGIVLPSFEALAGLVVGLFLVARFTLQRVTFMAALAAVVPAAINATNNALGNQPDRDLRELVFPDFWIFLTTWICVFALPVVLGLILRHHALRTREHEVELARASAEAVAAERARITQELHDIVAHSVSGIVLQAAGARAVHNRSAAGSTKVDQALGAIEASGAQALRELQRLLGLLRGSRGPGDHQHQPLHRTLDEVGELVDTTRSAGLEVTMTSSGTERRLDPSVEHAAYRMIQEGLTNAMKHAGVGADVTIRQTWAEGALKVSIRTRDGVRTSAKLAGGHGLANLSERIHLVGGSFEAMPLADGFLLSAQFPS